MSKQYNVNREVNDAFYRYKMPGIVAKVEGQGNGIKTVIVNMVDIARALNREAVYPTKYFGIELGAQTQIDKKNERFIVNGSHDSEKLQDILDGYIKKFVLCQQCENPETKLQVSKEDIFQTCMACGNKGKLRNMGHGLANFIVKQHKNTKIDNKRRKNKGEEENGAKPSTTTKDIYKGERAEAHTKSNGTHKDEWDGDEWNDSDSEDETSNQMAELSLREMKPSSMTPEQKWMAFEEYMAELIENDQLAGMMRAKEKIMQIILKADYYGVKQKAPFVLFEKLLTSENFAPVLKKYRGVFLYINRNTDDTPDLKAMKYMIHAFEIYIEKYPNLMDKCGVFLKFLYDTDVLDEEVIIEWGESKASKKYVPKELSGAIKEKCRKLVEWLKVAETESEDESSDDEGALEFAQGQVGLVEVKDANTPVVEEVVAVTVDGEDIEIEDI